MDKTCLEFDPFMGDGQDQVAVLFPGPLSEEMQVLRVTFDPVLELDGHYAILRQGGTTQYRAHVRQGVQAKAARAKWGLETGIVRCGLVVVGSCLPPNLMAKMETHLTIAAARRVGGRGRSTRI